MGKQNNSHRRLTSYTYVLLYWKYEMCLREGTSYLLLLYTYELMYIHAQHHFIKNSLISVIYHELDI